VHAILFIFASSLLTPSIQQSITESAARDLALVAVLEAVESSRQSYELTARFESLRGELTRPCRGQVAQSFGPVQIHNSTALARNTGVTYRVADESPVHAVARGIVVHAGELYGYGRVVILDHGSGYHTVYGHLGDLDVEPGETIQSSSILGRTGTLGHRVYFEIRHFGEPIDPAAWIGHRRR
jgi:septal ring factor EnvC (AmiA/AmiB activator)